MRNVSYLPYLFQLNFCNFTGLKTEKSFWRISAILARPNLVKTCRVSSHLRLNTENAACV